MSSKLLLAIAAGLPLALAGCLNSSGTTTAGSPSGSGSAAPATPGAPTPPVRLARGLNVIHLEMTDQTSHPLTAGARAYLAAGGSSRYERVCPGVPPRGNLCELGPFPNPFRSDIAWVARNFLDKDSLIRWTGAADVYGPTLTNRIEFFIDGDAVISVDSSATVAEFLVGFGQHSGILTSNFVNENWVSGVFSAAFGELHGGRPIALESEPSGTAVWNGAMFGTDKRLSTKLVGNAMLAYSFADNTIDVNIANIRKDTSAGLTSLGDYTGPTGFSWTDLRVNSDASFYIPGYGNDRIGTPPLHSTLGYIDGDFYGPNAEESAGVFERGDVSGAWLAFRGGATDVPAADSGGEPGGPADPGNR